MVFEDRREVRVEPTTTTALEQIFANRRSSGRSLIYCACSTFVKTDRRFLQQIVEAVSSRPQWDLVLGLGGQLAPDQLFPLPANVHAFSWAPQLQVLKQADCVINNGGINSINECIYFGAPMLVYSLKRFDQTGNAARIKYHGLGIVGDLSRDDATQVRNHIQTLLTDPSYQMQMARMRDRFHRYADENSAVRAVEALLNVQPQEKKKETLAANRQTLLTRFEASQEGD